MTNREKLFKRLGELSNRMLADAVNLHCTDCPAYSYCSDEHTRGLSCQETMCNWLNENDRGSEDE